ncbi:MAG: repair protein RecO protein [Parcubacteria group bacterium GW2011_GWB1_35_5]|nr:MAG: repair protein RecO protein [Parcubacteria group bacterium GW2011_GWB1_35_5]
MYRKYHTKGIVISSKIEGDSNKRVNIFTENFGLLNARVQGSRNIHSKLRSGSQDFSFGDFSLIHGKTGWKVVSSRAEQNFYEVFRNSQTKLKIVNNVLNLIKKLVSEEEAYTPLFSVVSNFLNFLITAKEQDVSLSECLTLLRILHILGFMRHDPEFSIPISSSEIKSKDLEAIAPKRSSVIKLINESLKAT